jgi:hypothetical protein
MDGQLADMGEGARLLVPSWMCWLPGMVWLFDGEFVNFAEDCEEGLLDAER